MPTGVIALTQKQFARLDVINQTISGSLTIAEAADALGLSTRQIKRLKKDVTNNGPAALVHKNTLRKPTNAISQDTVDKIINLKQSNVFKNANFKHFQELLDEHHHITISYSALRTILLANGISSPKTKHRYKPHRRRKRKPQAGLLLQVDATPFAWFDGDKTYYALHGAIDDATGQITALYLCKNECLNGYFEMLRRSIINYGVPISLYADRHTIFQSPKAGKVSLDQELEGLQVNKTQFGRALDELNIQLIAARSPQAKGRIERLWGTLQSRLPVEFALRNITEIDAANNFLAEYIYIFNSQFAVEAADSEKAFRKLSAGINLDNVLCIKEERTLDNGQSFSYHGKHFKLAMCSYLDKVPSKAKVTVMASTRIGVKASYKGFVFETVCLLKPKKEETVKHTEKDSKKQAASADKPKRQPFQCTSGQWYDTGAESDQEILEMLDGIMNKKYA